MSDKMDGNGPEDLGESAAVEEVRAAWLGLIRLLAGEVVRRFDRPEQASEEDTTPAVPTPTRGHPERKRRSTNRSRDQAKG